MLKSDSITKKILGKPMIERFPFPFDSDSYQYSNNVKPLHPSTIVEVTPEYFMEIEHKRNLLTNNHERGFQSFEHTLDAQWELLELIMNEMVISYPDYFGLEKNGNQWKFKNYLLDEEQSFIFGDTSSLPYEPLDFIGRHVQEDLIYMSHRDGELYLDAGQLCASGGWSIAFYLGSNFLEIHNPVPQFSQLAKKINSFLLRMEAGKPWTRLNWLLNSAPILDNSPENFRVWGPNAWEKVTIDNVGQMVHLRIEEQKLFRLPGSNGILFGIHVHLISLDEMSQKEEWMELLYKNLSNISDEVADYKGFLAYKEPVMEYLEEKCKK